MIQQNKTMISFLVAATVLLGSCSSASSSSQPGEPEANSSLRRRAVDISDFNLPADFPAECLSAEYKVHVDMPEDGTIDAVACPVTQVECPCVVVDDVYHGGITPHLEPTGRRKLSSETGVDLHFGSADITKLGGVVQHCLAPISRRLSSGGVIGHVGALMGALDCAQRDEAGLSLDLADKFDLLAKEAANSAIWGEAQQDQEYLDVMYHGDAQVGVDTDDEKAGGMLLAIETNLGGYRFF